MTAANEVQRAVGGTRLLNETAWVAMSRGVAALIAVGDTVGAEALRQAWRHLDKFNHCAECDAAVIDLGTESVCVPCREANALKAELASSPACPRCDEREAEYERRELNAEYERSISGGAF